MPEEFLYVTDTLAMCKECYDKSGRGEYIKVRYSSAGGWSPKVECRVCEHLSAQQILDHIAKKKEGKEVKP